MGIRSGRSQSLLGTVHHFLFPGVGTYSVVALQGIGAGLHLVLFHGLASLRVARQGIEAALCRVLFRELFCLRDDRRGCLFS